MIQLFHKGDLVHVAKDLGPSMSHFTNDVDAVVVGSYKDKYGGGNTKSYTLRLKNKGESSWYEEHQLTLIEAGRLDLLKQWDDEAEALHRQRSDLNWIFQNGPEVLQMSFGSSVQTLGEGVGVHSLWGSHGEGLAYYENAARVLHLAKPFLETNDKLGWLEFCKTTRISTVDYKIE